MGLRWTHKEIKKERLIRIRMSNSIVKNSDIAELLARHGESAPKHKALRQATRRLFCGRKIPDVYSLRKSEVIEQF